MWAKFVLALGAAAILLVALIIYVDDNNTDSPPSENLAAQTRANREADLVVERDQAPHVVSLTRGVGPRSGFVHTVRGAMDNLIGQAIVDGPLQRVRCTRHAAASGMLAFSCVATANDVNYDFVGVVDLASHRLTYCKRDEPPIPSQNIPVSPRCTL
jgi:tetrahydromethanopterin S-methyltransferase subunit D